MANQIPQQSFIQSLFGGFKKKPSLSGPTKVDLSYQLPADVVAAMNQDARLGSMAAQTTLGTGTDLFTAILKETERAVYGEQVIKKQGGEDKILDYVSDTLDEYLNDPAYDDLKKIADWSDKDDIKKDYESYIQNYQSWTNAERIKNGQAPIEGFGLYEKALPAKVDPPGILGLGQSIRQQAQAEAQAHFQAYFDEPMGKYGLPLAAQADIHKELPKMFEWKLSSKSKNLEAEKDKLEVALGTHQVAGGSYTSPAAVALRAKLAEIARKLKVIEEALDSDTATSAKNELKSHLNEKTKNILSWLVRRYQDGRIWADYIKNPIGTFWKQAVMGENKFLGKIGGFELQKKVKEFQNKIWRSLPGGRVLRRLSFLRNPRLALLRLAARGLVKGSRFLLKNFVLSGLRLLLPKLALLMFKGALMVSKFAIGIGVALVKVVIAKFGSILAALSAAASFIGAGLSALFAGVTMATLAIAGAVVAVGITIGLVVSLFVAYPFMDLVSKNSTASAASLDFQISASCSPQAKVAGDQLVSCSATIRANKTATNLTFTAQFDDRFTSVGAGADCSVSGTKVTCPLTPVATLAEGQSIGAFSFFATTVSSMTAETSALISLMTTATGLTPAQAAIFINSSGNCNSSSLPCGWPTNGRFWVYHSATGATLHSDYGARIDLVNYEGTAIDIFSESNRVCSTLDGVVDSVLVPPAPPFSLFDNHAVLIVNKSTGYSARFGHLKPGSVAVTPGQNVQRGQFLGIVGKSGFENLPIGTHLHYAIYAPGASYSSGRWGGALGPSPTQFNDLTGGNHFDSAGRPVNGIDGTVVEALSC